MIVYVPQNALKTHAGIPLNTEEFLSIPPTVLKMIHFSEIQFSTQLFRSRNNY